MALNGKKKAGSVLATAVDQDAGTVSFTVAGFAPLVVRMERVSPECKAYAALHGIKQRGVDAGALGRGDDGKPAAPADIHASVARVVEHLNSGATEWRLAASGAGLDTIALRAVAEVTGKTVERVREMVEAGAQAKDVTQRAYLNALAGSPKVAPVVARLRAEGVDVDADAALEEMMAD